MKTDLLEHERVQAWRSQHPREWWAYEQLEPTDDLTERVLAAVLGGRGHDEALDEITLFADALEARRRAEREGTVVSPPGDGERRSFQARILRMRPMSDDRRRFFRVDFTTPYGWSGFFDTTNPDVVERIAKRRERAAPVQLVGEITRRPRPLVMEMGPTVRIV